MITSYALGIVLGKLTKNVLQGSHGMNNTTFLQIKKTNLRFNHMSKSQSKKMAEPDYELCVSPKLKINFLFPKL